MRILEAFPMIALLLTECDETFCAQCVEECIMLLPWNLQARRGKQDQQKYQAWRVCFGGPAASLGGYESFFRARQGKVAYLSTASREYPHPTLFAVWNLVAEASHPLPIPHPTTPYTSRLSSSRWPRELETSQTCCFRY